MQKIKKILFIIGSPNQTTQMHKIASCLPDFDCYYSQFYTENPILKSAIKLGLADNSILAGHFKEKADKYLEDNNLKNDYAQTVYNNKYDLVVSCTDLIVPESVSRTKTIFVQEGMTDALNFWSKVVKALKLPPYFAVGTSLNGSTDICDIYCVASEGYKKHFASLGTNPEKIVVTGIPNFDNVNRDLINDFPHKGYVLVATSDIRETLGFDNRPKFIKHVSKLASGRKLIFKLHPNEKADRAIAEIKKYAPSDTLVYTSGNINHMIANCDELITQYSTVAYVGLALNKKVHSYFDIDNLKKLIPIQNRGKSAENIARICREYIEFDGSSIDFLKKSKLEEAISSDYRHTA